MADIKVPIAKPIIGEEEIENVVEVLKSGMIAQGPKVMEFEEKFANWIGAKYGIATNSGTSALHVALLACGIGEGDEVITTPFTFIASGNAIVYTGATPVFADIDLDTYTIDPDKIEDLITDKTKAILPVQLYGQAADMDKIREIAEKHDLKIIEDAAQAHGAEYNGEKVGTLGDMACFSFYPTKNMTTSEGGMITTDDEELAKKAQMFRAHGASERYHHDEIGYNFRMTDIAAAIGLAQLKVIDEFNDKRISNANYLNEQLKDVEGIVTPKSPDNYKHVYHQYTILVEKGNRDDWVEFLTNKGIGTGIHYPIPLYNQPIYKKLGIEGDCPLAEKAADNVISLPVHPSLTKEDLDLVVDAVKEASAKFC
ncbi:UDP-2-acetamido-2-deoxy-3-oxo-D-glucuronate aminotransferase [Methanobrevibacter woesei]|uniref:UDP-2-acetamido-2-deoxy-3-oxo-D-glucuronate aminotransferase n=1 Tax=Methanobrevibacter woesei TaxID=190976 RepID=A0A2U1S6Z5_9EURY|nr:DegT/DnrJ/EryC1/StrS family aminotransferase [Methanobrevibacter woesei]PWB85801.1 UDP-2-acetamido-2-deoxy-3-oxo-D-glucuronate aminotransferase [Methanobrevibacter woesei]